MKTIRNKMKLHLDKYEEKCTKCGIYKRFCSTQVTEVYENTDCLKVKAAGKNVLSFRNWLKPSDAL